MTGCVAKTVPLLSVSAYAQSCSAALCRRANKQHVSSAKTAEQCTTAAASLRAYAGGEGLGALLYSAGRVSHLFWHLWLSIVLSVHPAVVTKAVRLDSHLEQFHVSAARRIT